MRIGQHGLRVSAGAMLLLAGCASTGAEQARTRSDPPHPFTVVVTVFQEAGIEVPGTLRLAVLDPESLTDIREKVAQALEANAVFTAVVTEESPQARADLELRVTLTAKVPGLGLGDVTTNSNRWWNLGLWFLAGVPAWIIPDTEFDPQITAKYEVLRRPPPLKKPNLTLVPVNFEPEDRTLNFFRRAGPWQYVQQILIPPFLVGSKPERADASLYESFVARLAGKIAEEVKKELINWQQASSVPLLEPHREDDSGPMVLVLASPYPVDEWVVSSGAPAQQRTLVLKDAADLAGGAAAVLEKFWQTPRGASLLNTIGGVNPYSYVVDVAEDVASSSSGILRVKAFCQGQELPWPWSVPIPAAVRAAQPGGTPAMARR